MPTRDQLAIISAAGAYTVTLSDAQTVGGLTFDNADATLHHTAGRWTSIGVVDFQSGNLRLSGGEFYAIGGLTTGVGTEFVLDGGTVFGTPSSAGPVTLNSTLTWSSGVFTGSNDGGTFTANAAVNLVGAGTRTLNRNRSAAFNAGGTWDAGRFEVGSFTTLRLAAGQTITNTTASGDFELRGTGNSVGGIVDNRGTFIKQGVNTTTIQNAKFNNNGVVDVQAGTLWMASGGTHTGTFTVQSGATLVLNNSNVNAGSVTVNGAGTLSVRGATFAATAPLIMSSQSTLRLDLGSLDLLSTQTLAPNVLTLDRSRLETAAFVNPKHLTLTGASLLYGTDTNLAVQAGGSFTWESGELATLRNVTVAAPAAMPGTGVRKLTGDTFSNRTITMTLNAGGTWDAGTIETNRLARLQLPAGQTLVVTTASGNAGVVPPDFTAAGGLFVNAGTLRKEGPNTLTFGRSVVLDNLSTGVIEVRGGSVVVTDTQVQTSGRVVVGAGATFRGELALNGSATTPRGRLEGDGTVSGTVRVSGGRIRGGESGTGTLTIAGNNPLVIQADPGGSNGRLVVQTARTGVDAADASRIVVTGTGSAIFTELRPGWRFGIELLAPDLVAGETYTVILLTAGGGIGFGIGGGETGAGYVFDPADYELTSPDFAVFTDVQLALRDANTLTLKFTPAPVPEPTIVFAAAAAGLTAGTAGRRAGRLRLAVR